MKKKIIITTSVALALLLSSTTAFARGGHDNDGDNEDGGRHGNRSSQFVSNATDTNITQLLSLQEQIENLTRQLEALRSSSQIDGNTVARESDDDRRSKRQVCTSFKNQHRHLRRNRGNHFGFTFDQSAPERCKNLPGFGSSTTPVIDTIAPVISAITVSAINSTNVRINWTTNEDATSKIFISTTSPVAATGTPAWQDTAKVKAHGVQLNGLLPSTTYYFVIINTDASGNTSTSAQGSFITTALVVDVTAPIISGISVNSITATGSVIAWSTNESVSSKVFLSTTAPVSTSSATYTDSTLLTSHSAPLSALLANTTYYFIIQATDPALNTTYSVQGSFTTIVAPDTTAPILSVISAVPTSSTTATVSWMTNEIANSTVYYSTTTPVNTLTALTTTNASLVTSHSTGLTGLTASTTYFVIVASKDGANNLSTSSQVSFTTSN